MRPSTLLLFLQGSAAASLGVTRIHSAPVGSGRAMLYGIMALVGIGLVLALVMNAVLERARHVRRAREALRRMRAARMARAARGQLTA